jgi:hypothetical protein
MFILAPLDERDLFPQLVPELGIVRVDGQAVVVHRQIKVGEKQLTEVVQPNVDIATVRAFNRLNRTCGNRKSDRPLDDLGDQVVRQWLLRLVVARHFFQHFGLPAPETTTPRSVTVSQRIPRRMIN